MNQKPSKHDPVEKPVAVPARDDPRYNEALIDEAVAETLPASDPISPAAERDTPTRKQNPDRGGKEAWEGWPSSR
jgi:hypothetical protein